MIVIGLLCCQALELAREQKSDIKDQIWRSLAKAK